jgi:hypothetical protein
MCGRRVVPAVDLRSIEHAERTRHTTVTLLLLRVIVTTGCFNIFEEHNNRSLLSAAHLRSQFLPLAIACPIAGCISFGEGFDPEREDIHASIRRVAGSIHRNGIRW